MAQRRRIRDEAVDAWDDHDLARLGRSQLVEAPARQVLVGESQGQLGGRDRCTECPGETLVSSATAQFATGDITYRSRGEVILRGVREPMELYAVEPGPGPPAPERRSCREKGRRAPLGSV